jgi:hypothetical protein
LIHKLLGSQRAASVSSGQGRRRRRFADKSLELKKRMRLSLGKRFMDGLARRALS